MLRNPVYWPWISEKECTLHWALVINELDTRGSQRLSEAEIPITCGGQALSKGPAETQHRSDSLKDLPVAGSIPRGGG